MIRRRGLPLAASCWAALLALAMPAAAAEREGYKVPEAPPHCTAHFCVHYVREGPDAPALDDTGGTRGVPDYVETVAQAAELARSVENGRLRWREPVRDHGLGGGRNLTDIYIADLSDFANGATSTDEGQKGPRRSAYVDVHNRLDVDPYNAASVWYVIAHEYNHVLQDAYDAAVGGWMAESTATWMTDEFSTAIADEFLPVGSIFDMDEWVEQTERPITQGRPERYYGTAAWNHWLVSRYGARVIRRAWAALAKVKPRHFEPAAYGRAIRDRPNWRSRGATGLFSREFARFAAASAEWRARGFDASQFYPDVARRRTLAPGSRRKQRLDHTAYVLLNVPPTTADKLVLKASVQRGTKSAVALVARRGSLDDGEVTRSLRYLRRGGSTRVTLKDADRFDRITAVLVNADPSQKGRGFGGGWRWTRNDRVFSARLRRG